MTRTTDEHGRRRLLTDAVRIGMLAALGWVSGRLLLKSRAQPLHPDETCTERGECRGCRSLASCRSLQADLFRRGKEFRT